MRFKKKIKKKERCEKENLIGCGFSHKQKAEQVERLIRLCPRLYHSVSAQLVNILLSYFVVTILFFNYTK